MVDTDPNVPVAEAAPEIQPGNPGGYQPGDPNSPIDLPPMPDMSSPNGILVGDLPPPTEALGVAQPGALADTNPALQPHPPSDVPPGNFGGGVTEDAAPQPAVLSEQTLAEQAAGRAAVERAAASVRAARARAEEGNAARLRNNGPADEGDLSYSAPKE